MARQNLWGHQDTNHVVQEWLNVLEATFCDEHLQNRWNHMLSALIYMATMWRSSLM